MNTRMILTDLDGTLLRSDGSVSERTKDVLKSCQDRGIYVVIATARYLIGAERYIDELRPDYEITTDGTLIHRHGEQIYSCALENGAANRIIGDILSLDSKAEITAAAGKTVYWNSEHISESEKLHKAVYCDFSEPLDCPVNKIVAQLPDDETAKAIAEKNLCRLQCYRGEKWYAFMPENAGKIQAIKALADILGISLAEIVSFGDDKNDTEMLKMCGTGVAVGNAVTEVKAAADFVTLSNDEDGAAKWIARNILADAH